MKKILQNRLPIMESGHAIESLRESDYTFPSTIGELIDNSIQADAKTINIQIEDHNIGHRKPLVVIKKVICADDGSGMSVNILENCIVLGYSERYGNREGIGRFGVGMTLAAIRFARKIEVYSKTKSSSKWHYVSFDLTNEEDRNKGVAIPAIEKNLPAEYAELSNKEHGTVVIWSDFDKIYEYEIRQSANSDDFEPKYSLNPYGLLNHWIGRTYRKFIWKGLKINLNDVEVKAFDPLYLTTTKTQFPKDEHGELLLETDLLHEDIESDNTYKIHLKFSLLPLQFRQESGKGGRIFEGRYIDENQGFSILRNEREIHFDTIPYMGWAWNDQLDRWWSCEISFPATMDEIFNVKHIKSKPLRPSKELRESLVLKLKDVRKLATERVRSEWIIKEQEHSQDESGGNHGMAEKIAKKVKIPGNFPAGKGLSKEEEEKRRKALCVGVDELEKALIDTKFSTQPYQVVEGNWSGDTFIDMTFLNGKEALQYNRRHVFIQLFKESLEELKTTNNLLKIPELTKEMSDLFDIMLMALVKARQSFNEEETFTAKSLLDELIPAWGRFLRSYIEQYEKENKKND